MNLITNIFRSSLGRKYIMAATGFALFLFVIAHLAGNLQIFLGPEAMSGLIVLAFVIYHLLHYTVMVKAINLTGRDFAAKPEFYAGAEHDIFKMMVVGFSNGWVSGFYLIGMALLCLHLSHGASSMFQSIGWSNEEWRPVLEKFLRVLAVLIFLGYSSIPVAVLLGYGKEALK